MLTSRYLNGIPDSSRAASKSPFLKPSDLTDERIDVIRKLAKHAAERGEALSQMALKWVLKDDKVTSVLVGASSKEQILENIGAVEGNLFTLPELRELEEIVSPVIYD